MAKTKSAARKGAAKTARKRTGKKAVKRTVTRAAKRAPARAARKTATKKAASRSRNKGGAARNVAVVVGDLARPQIEKVASRLRARGMKVDSVLGATGTITGTYSKNPSGLTKVEGVTAAEELPPIQLPPLGSDTPQ